MPSKKRKNDYSGKLNQPMISPRPKQRRTLATSRLENPLDDPEILTEYRNRVAELFFHFGVDFRDEHAWMHLALSLAHKHVPGFEFKRRGGAPQIWNPIRLREIYNAVNRVRARDKGRLRKKPISVLQASALLKKEKVKPDFVEELTPGTIRRRYEEAQKSRKSILIARLSRWLAGPGPLDAPRRPNFKHPFWQRKIREGDLTALALKEKTLSNTIIGRHLKKAERKLGRHYFCSIPATIVHRNADGHYFVRLWIEVDNEHSKTGLLDRRSG